MTHKEQIQIISEFNQIVLNDPHCSALWKQYRLQEMEFDEMLIRIIILLHRKKEQCLIELCEYIEKNCEDKEKQ